MFLQFWINIILTYLIVFGMSIFMGKEASQVVAALSVADEFEIPYLAGVVMVFYLPAEWCGNEA